MENFAGADAPYIVEHKFFYNEDQEIISGLVRYGEQSTPGQLRLEGIPFKNDNPNLGATNETYLLRLAVALKNFK